jgi:hypothetical protein
MAQLAAFACVLEDCRAKALCTLKRAPQKKQITAGQYFS